MAPMDASGRGPGLALVLSPDGWIVETLRRPSNCRIGPGIPFEAIIDSSSRLKAELFLADIQRTGVVFGWEMVSFIEDRPAPYFFTGLRLGDRTLVLCALHHEDLFRLFEEFTAVADIRPDIWKAALRQLAETLARGADIRSAEIEELNRLNREMAILQAELSRKNSELEVLYAEVQRQAETDALTGLLNRRGFFLRAERDFLRARRYGQGFAIIMIDIDHFKDVNDRWGHIVGDQVLAGLAALLKKGIRETDLLARYGGEEFVLLAIGGEASQAMQAGERLRLSVEKTEIESEAGRLSLTISLGVASYEDDTHSLDEVVKEADQALYEAKRLGRNRTESFRPAETT